MHQSSSICDITGLNTSQVTNMEYMFANAQNFNQLLNDWDTSQVTNPSLNLTATGSGYFLGDVQASGYFIGDGSKLTNLSFTSFFDSLVAGDMSAVNDFTPSTNQFAGLGYIPASGSYVNSPEASDWTGYIRIYDQGQADFNSSNNFNEDRVLEIRNNNGANLFYKAIVSQGVATAGNYDMTVKKVLFANGNVTATGSGQLGEAGGSHIILI